MTKQKTKFVCVSCGNESTWNDTEKLCKTCDTARGFELLVEYLKMNPLPGVTVTDKPGAPSAPSAR